MDCSDLHSVRPIGDAELEGERKLPRLRRVETGRRGRDEVVGGARGDVGHAPVEAGNAICDKDAVGGQIAKGDGNVLALEAKLEAGGAGPVSTEGPGEV